MSRLLILVAAPMVTALQAAAQLPPLPKKPNSGGQTSPRLQVDRRMLDLGTIIEGDVVPVRWRIENQGNADLIIEQTKSSCGCTVLKLADTDRIVPPGGSLELQAHFDSTRRPGNQRKTITVQSNDPAEPVLRLEFAVVVEGLYNIKPPGIVNLGTVQRGETATKTIDIFPAKGRKSVEIREIHVDGPGKLRFQGETMPGGQGAGRRIHMTVADDLALGTLRVAGVIRLAVDGIDREYPVTIRAEVVGDLVWQPRVVDATRQPSMPGRRLAPVSIRATNKRPFDILGAEAGPLFDVSTEMLTGRPKQTGYRVLLTLRDDAPPGPFGENLTVMTSSADQPVIEIPVFGIVSPPIKVDPPRILFMQNGTEAGMHRRIKLQASTDTLLEIGSVTCDNAAVSATLDSEAGARYQHLRYLDVRLSQRLPAGEHTAELTVTTNVDGAERIHIPVTITVIDGNG